MRPITSKKSLGALLKENRLALGLSQEELAIKANLSQADISEIERGRRNLSFDLLLVVLAALDLEILLQSKKPEIDNAASW